VVAVGKGKVFATQFHPEKSGPVGLDILRSFLQLEESERSPLPTDLKNGSGFAKRVIACLDVRSNDSGDLVVTKVQYSLFSDLRLLCLGQRETNTTSEKRAE